MPSPHSRTRSTGRKHKHHRTSRTITKLQMRVKYQLPV